MPRKGHRPEQILKNSGKSRLPLRVARALGRQYVGSVSPTTLITGGDASTADSTSTRQNGSRDSNRRTHG